MEAGEPTAVLVNTASRGGRERFAKVKAIAERSGTPLVAVEAIDVPGTIPDRIRTALRCGARRVVVGGGDGTLSAVADVVAGQDVRMGVLPLGTGNDFARSLRIPVDLEQAAAIALGGSVRRVDVGVANGRVFLNAASIGLSSAATRRISDALKKRLGRGAFAVAAASEAWSHRPFAVHLQTDHGSERMDAHQVVVGNGRYHAGGRLVSPEASHSDRRLDVYVIRSAQAARPGAQTDGAKAKDLWMLLRVAMLLKRGRHVRHPAVLHLRCARAQLTAEPAQEIDLDGELVGSTPVAFKVRPGALQVLVPA
ncbi:MAG: lipid kinase [Myxococcaceae bacterium]|nr:lipid kinase [Myxococcaceae bacterium]